MAKTFWQALDIRSYLDLNQNELRNARVQNLGSAPGSPVAGQMYYNTGDNTLYWWNGGSWVAAKDAGATSVYYQTLKDGGTARTQRANVNFVDTTSATITVTDDAGNDESEITVDVQFGSVTAQTSFGASSGNGVASTAARSDHTHGTPATPTASAVGAVANGSNTPSIYQDVTGSRPAFGTAGRIFIDTTTKRLQRDTGSAWEDLMAFAAPSASAVGDVQGAGTASTYARSDHVHAREAFATPSLTLGTANASGSASTLIRSDATILAFDATSPSTQAIGDAAVVGVATVAARRDHKHAMPAFATNTIALGTAAAAGSAATLIRSDATIAAFDATVPTTIAVGAAAAAGSAAFAARRDHTHGMAAFGNVTAETSFGGSSSNGAASTIARSDHQHGTPTHNTAAHSAVAISGLSAPTTDVSWGGFKITSLGTPTASTDAATKGYVDSVSSGLDVKGSVRAASTGNVTVTYSNTGGTSARGQITAAPNTLDGVSLAANDRILLKDQSTGAQNGIWVVTTLGSGANGVWDRATDFDQDAEVTSGAFTFVEEGSTNADSGWVLTTNNPITIGGASGTALVWAQFSGAGQITAGSGLTKSGNTLNVGAGTGITVNTDDVAIDTSVVVRKYAVDVGNGSNTDYTITHNLGTRDVTVAVFTNGSNYDEVGVDVEHSTTNTVTLKFSSAPASNAFRCVVHA